MYRPQAFKQTNRKARKQHKCCECSLAINPGDTYSYSSGIWDSQPLSFKLCNSCESIFKVANNFAVNYDYDYEFYPSFGGLREWVTNFIENEGVILQPDFSLPDTDYWTHI